MSFKDQLEEWWIATEFALTKNQLIAIIVLASIIAASWFFYYFSEGSSQTPIKVSNARQKPKSGNLSMNEVLVHVAGAVKAPGVYKVKDGARVIEAIELAGGFAKDADKDSLNLAAKVVDSAKISVPLKSQTVSSQGGPSSLNSELVNLNTASAEQLKELPGIGEVMAKRMVEYREEKGSFSSVEQLKEIEGIGDKKFAKLKNKVTL